MDYKRLYAIASQHIKRRRHAVAAAAPLVVDCRRLWSLDVARRLAHCPQKSADGVYIGRRRLSSCLSSCYCLFALSLC